MKLVHSVSRTLCEDAILLNLNTRFSVLNNMCIAVNFIQKCSGSEHIEAINLQSSNKGKINEKLSDLIT